MSIEPVSTFSVLVGLAVARTLRRSSALRRLRPGLAPTTRLGQSAQGVGLIPALKLSVRAMAASGVAFLALVAAGDAALPLELRAPAPPSRLYHLLAAVLRGARRRARHRPPAAGAHPPRAQPGARRGGVGAGGRLHVLDDEGVVTSAYCGAGANLPLGGERAARRPSRFNGATLQAFLFEAMFLSTPKTHLSCRRRSRTSCRSCTSSTRRRCSCRRGAPPSPETLAPLVLLAPPHFASLPSPPSASRSTTASASSRTSTLSRGGASRAILRNSAQFRAILDRLSITSTGRPRTPSSSPTPPRGRTSTRRRSPRAPAPLRLPVGRRRRLPRRRRVGDGVEAAPLRTALSLAYVAVHLAAVVLLLLADARDPPALEFPMFGALPTSSTGRCASTSGSPARRTRRAPSRTTRSRSAGRRRCSRRRCRRSRSSTSSPGGGPDKLTANVELTDALAAALPHHVARRPVAHDRHRRHRRRPPRRARRRQAAFAAAPRAPTGTASPTKSVFVAEPASDLGDAKSEGSVRNQPGSTPVPHEKVGSGAPALTTGVATPLPPHSIRSRRAACASRSSAPPSPARS